MKKTFEKSLNLFLSLGLIISSFSFLFVKTVIAEDSKKINIITEGARVNEKSSIEFFDGDRYMGEVEIFIDSEKLGEIEGVFLLPEFKGMYDISFHFDVDDNFELNQVTINESTYNQSDIPGDFKIHYNLAEDSDIEFDVSFIPKQHAGDNHPTNSFEKVELFAEFEGITAPVKASETFDIAIPKNFTKGDVLFKVSVCEVDGVLVPTGEDVSCDVDTTRLEPLHVEGIIAKVTPNEIFDVSLDRFTLTFKENFFNYGKAGLHLVHEDAETNHLNFFVNLHVAEFITIKASADLSFIFDVGSSYSAEAFLPGNINEGDVSIFFGNNKVNLEAIGDNVTEISKIISGDGKVNPDGTVTINLPALSVETTTKVVLELTLNDGVKVNKTINIIRTSFKLHDYPDHGVISYSYIAHKAYLYENKNHDPDIFDAWLQVIFYKGDTIIGYKQVQINDTDFINSLGKDESAEMFANPEENILYDVKKDTNIKNPTKIAAFLTNGKIKYGEKLPSVEFGIGSGVVLELIDSRWDQWKD